MVKAFSDWYKIQDIVIIEDKLSEGTRLTTHQNGGKDALGLTVRSNTLNPSSSIVAILYPKKPLLMRTVSG